MDLNTLTALGINKEDLFERVVEQTVSFLLSTSGFDSESEREVSYATKFKREIEKRIQKAVDDKIAALAEVHLIPRVGELIESANLQKTNSYGEAKGAPMTFIEYIASRADAYMNENVDFNGKSKEEGDSYNWRSVGPRLTVLMRGYIRETLESHAKNAISDVNKVLAKGMEKAATDAIHAAAAAVKVSVQA